MLQHKLIKILSDGLCVWCFVFLILMDMTSPKEVYGHPSSDFSKHSIVKPKLQHGRTKREITSTKIQDSTGSHHPEVTLIVSIDGEEQELDLRLNEALVPSGHSLSYQQNGRTRVLTPGKEELDICQYSGRVRGKPGSWAAVSTCRGVRGVVYDGQRLRYIEPVDGNNINAEHFLYSHEHLTRGYHCGNPDGPAHNSSDQQLGKMARKRSRDSRYKRNVESPELRMPSSANQRSRYVELVLVVDHDEFLYRSRDLHTVHRHMKDLANIINSVYAPLNIFIALVGVEVWTEHDKITIVEGAPADDALHEFSRYRSTELVKLIPNDNAHLFTRKSFNGNVVGRAYVNGICSSTMSVGVISDHSRVIGLVAMTIAHEMGHNFGMDHDKNDCKCADEKCIMSDTSTSVIPERWSSCSLQYLSLSYEKGLDHCLRNKPERLFSSPTCGNGFLEEGEQCDCGPAPGDFVPENVRACQSCCKPDCTLKANATCAHGQCCDLTTCSPKAIGTECRAATLECDLPEFCNGTSPFCPLDVLKMDATPCGNEKAYCVRGSCRSHTDQCRLLWGVTGNRSDDVCYDYNADGISGGNCGYKRVTGTYLPCAKEDVVCGRLQCNHLSKQLEYSNFETATISDNWPIINRNRVIPCRSVAIDLGTSNEDPGLVPDGAKCGPDKMCMQQKCMPVEQVRQMVKPEGSVCPSNCSGHGVCNSNGNCHCEPGYAPPLCALPGPGGSYDSGPIVDTSSLWWFMVAMYIIFLGLVPAVALVLLLVYCRRNHALCWKKNDHHYEKPSKLRFGSKFALPNFNSFGKWLKKDKVINCNNTVKGQQTTVNTKHEDIEEHVYTAVCYDVIKKSVVNNTVAPTSSINNKTIIKEPITLNHKLQENVVIVDNCSYYAQIHKNPVNNIDVEFKPKVNAMKNKFESLSVQTSNSVSPNFKDLNKELLVLTNNKSGSPINRPKPSSHVMPKPNLSPNPRVNQKTNISPELGFNHKPSVSVRPKPGASPKPSVTKSSTNVNLKPELSQKLGVSPKPGVNACPKPSVNPRPNRLPRETNSKPEIINAGLASTTNQYLNQRSKLRKVTNIRDVNK